MVLLLKEKVWWNYLDEDLKELLLVSGVLVEKVPSWPETFDDYAFVVFPAAKAYEGFLKKLFLEMGFITRQDYSGKRFRVGKALNPYLERKIRREESVYDRIVDFCQGEGLAQTLWETWKAARNKLFHWFPEEKNAISFEEAKGRIEMIFNAMDAAFKECKLK